MMPYPIDEDRLARLSIYVFQEWAEPGCDLEALDKLITWLYGSLIDFDGDELRVAE